MITNLVILSVSLLTNQQQAIVGESQGKALIASQETVVQRTITLEDVVLSSRVSTNAVGFAFPQSKAPPTMPPAIPSQTNAPNLQASNTNSPAFKRRLEREQRMKPSTNTPPAK